MLETIIIGNIGSARFVEVGEIFVLNLAIASSRRIGDKEYTDWVAAKLWGERAKKLREHITVGMKLLLRGRPEAKAYERNDGTVAGELVLHVNHLEFLSAKPKFSQPEQLPLKAPATARADSK